MDERYARVSGASGSVVLMGTGAASGLHMSALEGWYGTPDGKWSLTERQLADGAFALAPEQVSYSSRTVTVDGFALGESRGQVLSALGALRSLAHEVVTLSVADGGGETFSTGALSLEVGKGWSPTSATFTLTIVCPDPRRYGSVPHRAYMVPGTGGGGLEWSGSGAHGLEWPLSFADTGGGRNVVTMWNAGTSVAYPTITASGSIDWLTITDVATGGQVSYSEHVGWTPLVLDCLGRTAAVAGVDMSRALSRRDFPSVPAGGSTTLALTGTGTGTVAVEWRDTYI